MGWVSTSVSSNITTKKFVEYDAKRILGHVYEVGKIVEGKTVFGQKAFYISLKRIDSGYVSAMVVLTKRKKGTVFIKYIPEEEGPLYFEAPISFINSLSITFSDTAHAWRMNCVEVAQKKNWNVLIGKESA
jgi:hypothetical protein